jgi:hypothetical protein
MGDFDKIIKENLEAVFLPLVEKLLGIKITQSSDLSEKIQSTIEREPDFIKQVTDETDSKFILQLEFQTNEEPKMVYRMAEYKALLQRKYEIPVRQFVIYLGTNKPKMKTELADDEKITGFELKNIHDMPVEKVLGSDIPEEIILSILTDYPKVDTGSIINQIIRKLQKLSSDEATLKRYIQQLLVLSRLRNLDKETEKQVKDMPITYNVETDYLYNKGIEKGLEKRTRQMIIDMLSDPSMTVEKIASFARTSVDFVLNIKEEFRK